MAVRVRIEGRVQGAGFRYWVVRAAGQLSVDGWVRNRRDGSVEALFDGDEESVRQIVSRCHEGPPVAYVTTVQEFIAEPPESPGFQSLPTAP
ncbi:MAG: acylphosphatase [Alphaproteobacteria bacterium]|nr:acylphosphatase [Alphaproteobacteria bacterium]